jgi:hypothetical protein
VKPRRSLTIGIVASLVATGIVIVATRRTAEAYAVEGCVRRVPDGWSVARVWDEALLDAIRRDTPAPTVHARNLFHTSAAMWDAWAAYDPHAEGYFVDEKTMAPDVTAAREAAISFAAYRVLLWRYRHAAGLQETFDELVRTMEALCYRIDYVETDADTPAALGNRIAAAAIAAGLDDGALEATRYVDTRYTPVNPPMVVEDGGTEMVDPNRWQPLALAEVIAQNGLPIPGSVQRAIGPHWGHVRSFALPASAQGTPIDPGPPPRLDDPASHDAFQRGAVDVIRASASLDATDGATIDISPGAYGDNSLGVNDGDGRSEDPTTGEPYAPNVVAYGDFARVLTEYWADGPASETPPGHWNTIANDVSDQLGEHRIGGEGPDVDRLEWDVKLYLALNGAVHDAAIAAWGVKGYYDTARPISMIRYMGGLGQSSDPSLPSYDPDGLPLVPGSIELVTRASSAQGERHETLVRHVGEIAVRAWLGNPEEPNEASGVGWIPATEWVPYQRDTFVTPSFPGYVSGHSSFSRAAAEVLTAYTGSAFFPGGMAEWTVPAGSLTVEAGPTTDVTLQWATYFDAADQAGISRIYGGIHIPVDDFAGRQMGAICGKDAWALAQTYYDGSAA